MGAIKVGERASLKPYALVTSLLRILINNHSLQLHTGTKVRSLEPPSQKNKYHTIHTSRGTCYARHIVNATNAWIGHLYPEFQGKIVPARGQVIHVEGDHLKLNPMGWNYGGEYLVQRPNSTIIFGGGRRYSTTSTFPPGAPRKLRFLTVEHAEIGNADDTTIDGSVSQFLHTFLPSQFSFTKTLGTEPPVESIREWTGIMGFSHDLHPYVGSDPDEPTKWVIGGFHGHGMVRIFLSAKVLAQQLISQHQHLPLTWPPWFPKAYRYPSPHKQQRITIDEILHYLSP